MAASPALWPGDEEESMTDAAIAIVAVLPDGRCIKRGRGWRTETTIRESTGALGFEPASVFPVW